MLDFVAKMTRNHNEASQTDIQALRDVGFSDAYILSIIYWVANFNLANTLTNCTGLEPHEHMRAMFVDELPEMEEISSPKLDGLVHPDWEKAVVRALEGIPLEWINTDPLTWDDVFGKVLLVTYWDGTHSNSLVGIPHLLRWFETYDPKNLMILAVHAVEFPLAKDPNLAKSEIERLGITYPVVLDPTYDQLAGRANRFWPAVHLVDRNGFVRFRHYGPGGYKTIEAQLQALLAEEDTVDDRKPKHAGQEHGYMNPWLHPEATPELYPSSHWGSHRLGLAGPTGEVKSFSIPDEQALHMLYVDGDWVVRVDGLELVQGPGRLIFQYRAERVGLYATPPSKNVTKLHIRLDGKPLPASDAGQDLNDQSQVVMDQPRFYWLAHHPSFESHQIELELDELGTRVHRLSFLPFRGVLDDS